MVWVLQNVLQYGDLVSLLYVFFRRVRAARGILRNRKKIRLLQLKGYQLALSFKDVLIEKFEFETLADEDVD
ncbi:hypothetical protein HanIR_Chr04g0163321 [Helianthus annuus]|nr:hypothetical protein HanIR_Chr04g0163321 [Helianthus annuus]